ncbi:MAG: HTH-type transcriptional regulator HdfR [Desulfovibrio sp.]
METRDLHYFEVIAELEHMGLAAKKVHRTQPALTQCVQRLEQELGATLFERHGRGIRLTPMGEKLLEKARHLRRMNEEALNELMDYAHGCRGHIRLGCPPTMAAYLMPQLLTEMLREAPDMTMELAIGASDVLLRRLKDHEIDLLLTPLTHLGEGVEAVSIIEDDMVVAASADHPLFSMDYTVRDVAKYRWILLQGAQYSRVWLTEELARHGCPPPEVQLQVDIGVSYIKKVIHQTELLCFFSVRNIEMGQNLLRQVDVPELTLKRQFKLAYRTDGYLSPIANRFVSVLRTRGPELVEG